MTNTTNTSISSASASNGDTFKNLTASANKWRRGVIQALFNSAIVRNIGTTSAPVAEIENLDALSADFLITGMNPVEKSFSNHDIIHFGNELADERDVAKAKLAEVMNVITVARGRVNPLFLTDKTHFTIVIAKCNAVLSYLGEELDRRESEAKTAVATLAAQKAAQREKDIAEHKAFLDAMRVKYAIKPKVASMRVPNHAPHADRLVGKGLEALSVIKAEMDQKAVDETLAALALARKSDKFMSERVMTKAEALTITENLSNLPLVFPDGRVLDVVLNKAGKVYRYLLKE